MSTIRVNRFENTAGAGYGAVVQVASFQSGAVATGTTAIPVDDTIPQITEGTEFMTLAITPKSSTNTLKFTITMPFSLAVANTGAIALFQDANANALAARALTAHSAGTNQEITLVHYMTAGTTSSTTFRVRFGSDTGTTMTVNGVAGARKFGGVNVTSITIQEIQV